MTTRYQATTVPAPFPSTAAVDRVRCPLHGRGLARDWATSIPPRRFLPQLGA